MPTQKEREYMILDLVQQLLSDHDPLPRDE